MMKPVMVDKSCVKRTKMVDWPALAVQILISPKYRHHSTLPMSPAA